MGILRNAFNVWYHELFKYLEKMGNLSILDELLHIFNTDETGFPMAPWPTKAHAGKGDPHIYQQGSSDKLQITVLIMLNAMALYIPPLIIYPGCNFSQMFVENFYSNLPSVCSVTQQMGGWMPSYLRTDTKSLSSLKWKMHRY